MRLKKDFNVDETFDELNDELTDDDIINDDNVDSILPESELQKKSRMKCPRCKKNTLEIDIANGGIKCTYCGFKEAFPGIR